MGNREDLLAGAKKCLYEKGYARTKARDVAAASGVSLAAIGYHFGSMETLLNTALVQTMEDWGDELEAAFAVEVGPDVGPIERFELTWTRVIETFEAHRPVWVAQFEAVAQADRAPEVRAFFVEAMQRARLGLAQLMQNIDGATDEKLALAVGSFHQALLTGVMLQWLIDPEHAPSGADLATALRTILPESAKGGA